MVRLKRGLAATLAAAMCLSYTPQNLLSTVVAADTVTVDKTVRVKPSVKSTFNDTNHDGLGEFEGWGTSLCWWANRIGYSPELTSQAAKLFFSDEGLDMNIGRYNVGGGDNVGEVQEVPVNPNAVFYDLETDGRKPTYNGSNMEIGTNSNMSDVVYMASDADFGITQGEKVGTFKQIGYINKLDDNQGSGDNLHYTVNVSEAGNYTVKLLLTLTGSNNRDVAIRVGNDSSTDRVVDKDTVNAGIIASGKNNNLYVVTINDVALQAGNNQINIAGKNDWTLDFVKMAVIPAGKEGTLPITPHAPHIVRSDSAVPGYATDVTKIDLKKHDESYYTNKDNFARADFDCGYAWNYNWEADENQINVLKAAAKASGTDFIAEAFSNSPPYFMTESGCSSGNTEAKNDNLRADSVNAFAAYMADVIEHWQKNGITFQSATPMNEPFTNYWGANSNKQEGCHFDQGESQSRIIVALNKELKNKGIDLVISGTDETSIDTAITSYNALSSEAKEIVQRIDTHTYSGSDRAGLNALAEKEGKNLWMSEVDGAFEAGTNAGEMGAALGLADRIMTDVNGLESSAWILWNAIDSHSDSTTKDKWSESKNDFASMEDLYKAVDLNKGYWGLAFADHDKNKIETSMKYYGFGQFSRYIRPGYTILGSNNGNTLVAYDPAGKKAVIVAINTSGDDKTWKFDLSGFTSIGDKVTAIRTSGSMTDGEQWADVTKNADITVNKDEKYFTSTMKANSITTFTVEGVGGIGEMQEQDYPLLAQIPVDSAWVTGSTPWGSSTTNTPDKVVDNDYSTFFDGVTSGWVTIDLQQETEIAAVGYAPRPGYAGRCKGATIYGSNDGNDWIPLHTIDSVPPENKDTIVYALDFETTEHSFRYIKYAQTEKENANISELKVYKETAVQPLEMIGYLGKDVQLPKTVKPEGSTEELKVTWDLDEVSFDVKPFTYVTVNGKTEKDQDVTITVLMVPKKLEYMIDCNNPNSVVWGRLKDTLKNNLAPDQEKTEETTWGRLSVLGTDVSKYDDSDTNDAYKAGYYAKGGKDISYSVTLPAGKHEIYIGSQGKWWDSDERPMVLYYSVNGAEQELMKFKVDARTESCSHATLELEEEAAVTLTLKKNNGGDPILSWLAVADVTPPPEITEDRIVANNYLMYLVNCATPDAAALPDGYESMGVCQSSLDQRYGLDEETGMTWGLAPDNENSAAVGGGTSQTDMMGSYYFMDDKGVTYDKDKSGFLYTFALPERESDAYEVTVGIKNPWAQYGGTKYEDVLINGTVVAEDKNVNDGFKETFDVQAKDGKIEVFVRANPDKRKGSGDDPVINYIIVKAKPSYDFSALQAYIDSYKAKIDPSVTYGKPSKAAFDKAIDDAQKLVDENKATKEQIEEAMKAIETAYNNLKIVYTYDSITGTNGARIFDNNGNKIQAHGGQVQQFTVNGKTKYYWYGEDKTNGYRPVEGVHLYTSEDLYNWTDEGLALDAIEVPEEHYGDDKYVDLSIFDTDETLKKLYSDYKDKASEDPTYESKLEEVYWNLAEDRCVMERPKVLYNDKTGKYVMWWHCDGRTPSNTDDYGKARAGVAIADSPAGPFKYVGAYLLASGTEDHSWDAEGGHVRDMNLFKDDNGDAYVLYSSEGNAVMYIAKLNEEYTQLAKPADQMILGEDFVISSTDSREAPAMFKYNGKYYLITSGCTGWSPNQGRYAVADSPLGPWTNMGDPCVGDTKKTTFDTQSTCVIPVDAANGKFIYMGDRWHNPDTGGDLSDSRYVWLPIEFGTNGTIMIKDYKDWTLDALNGKGAITVNTKLPENAETVAGLMGDLPEALDVQIGAEPYSGTPVTWSVGETPEYALGKVTVTGTLTELGREITHTAFICPKDLVYFADCYTNNGANTSEVYKQFKEKASGLLNTVSDQKYGSDKGVTWGYLSTPGASGGGSSQDMGSKGSGDFFSTGWWATSSGTIRYGFELDPGKYVVTTGYQEWWSGSRGMKITVNAVDAEGKATEIGKTSFTLSGEQDKQVNTAFEVPEKGVDHVEVVVSKASGGDPILSWMGIVDTDGAYKHPEKVLSDFNNDGNWKKSEGAKITQEVVIEGEDEKYCLKETSEGTVPGTGNGSSYEVVVKPNTEYVLTGWAKVTNSQGTARAAEPLGETDYTITVLDGENNNNSLYSVVYTTAEQYEGETPDNIVTGEDATQWRKFTMRFVTGPSTTKIRLTTWVESTAANGGNGFLSSVAMRETGLNWSELDSTLNKAAALSKDQYTEETWAAFAEFLEEVKEFRNGEPEDVTLNMIRENQAKLEDAMAKLVWIYAPTGDATYYVDAVNGDDSKDGLTPETAWKTFTHVGEARLTEGAKVLLKAGSVWNGEQLNIVDAKGTEEKPIVIGRYGEGADPVINGNGAPWAEATASKEDLAAVHIKNSEHIVIEHLDITNWDASVDAETRSVDSYKQSTKLLSGLVVENRDGGTLHNVTIRNNKIHDVNGLMLGGADKAAGGLIVVVTGNGANHTGLVESKFDGLHITGNEVTNVCHEAIYMESVWAARTLVGGTSSDTGYQNAGNGKWIGSSDVTIENNYVHDVAGDGIVPINTTEALVQYNLVDNSADSSWDYKNNPNHAGLWTWDTDNVIFRYNEVCNTSKASKGTAVGNDSMAFDFDYGVQNCLYEYNYSHDNLGGFLMLCPGPGATVNNIARYNLSVNDGLYDGAPMIRVGGGKYGSNGVQIYNNTMYWGDTGYSASLAPASEWEGKIVTDVSIFNNIFYGPAKEGSVKTEGVTYANNCVYGGAENVYKAAGVDENAVIADPKFEDVKQYTTGSWKDGKTTLGTAEGFKLKESSPCIDKGAGHPEAPNVQPASVKGELVTNNTEKPVKDYYGNALSDGKIDIGANEYKEIILATPEEIKELETTLTEAEKYKEADYTMQSYARLRDVMGRVRALLANPKATQEEVNAAKAELEEAIKGLVKAEQQGSDDQGGTDNPDNQGSTGGSGNQGSTGGSGSQGSTGGSGSQGSTGGSGSQGSTGGSNNQGSTGSSGSQGNAGKTSNTNQAKAAPTGDTAMPMVYVLLMILSLAAGGVSAGFAYGRRRKG